MKLNSYLAGTLGIASLPEAEQAEILKKVDLRLEEVMLRVLVENLSPEEVQVMKTILKEGTELESKVAKISSGVPRLAEKMENAVTDEIEKLRTVLNG